MEIVARTELEAFWESPGSDRYKNFLQTWFYEVRVANWLSLDDLLRQYPKAQAQPDGSVLFSIADGVVGLRASVNFPAKVVRIHSISCARTIGRARAKGSS